MFRTVLVVYCEGALDGSVGDWMEEEDYEL